MFVIILKKTLLVNINPQVMPTEIIITIKPKPVFDNVAELEVIAVITKVSTFCSISYKPLCFCYLFLINDFHI